MDFFFFCYWSKQAYKNYIYCHLPFTKIEVCAMATSTSENPENVKKGPLYQINITFIAALLCMGTICKIKLYVILNINL